MNERRATRVLAAARHATVSLLLVGAILVGLGAVCVVLAGVAWLLATLPLPLSVALVVALLWLLAFWIKLAEGER